MPETPLCICFLEKQTLGPCEVTFKQMQHLQWIVPITEDTPPGNSKSHEQHSIILSERDENALFELYDELCDHMITENDIEKSSVLQKVDGSMKSLKKI